MGCFAHYRALCYKNWLLKKRKPVTTCSEVLLPLFFIGILGTIKNATEPDDIPQLIPSENTGKLGPYSLTTSLTGDISVQTLTDLHDFFGTADGASAISDGNLCDSTDFGVFQGVLFRCEENDDLADDCICQPLQIGIAAGDASLDSVVDDFIADQPATHTPGETLSMFRRFASPAAAADYVLDGDYSFDSDITPLSAIITFDAGPPGWEVTIRTNSSAGGSALIPPTDRDTNSLLRSRLETDLSVTYLEAYTESGFLLLQNTISEFVLKTEAAEAGVVKPTASRFYLDFPSVGYTEDGFWDAIGESGNIFGIFIVIALVYPFATVVRLLVMEKELRIREGMKMMALGDTPWFLSWFTCFFIINTVTAILITIMSTGGGALELFSHSDAGLIFALFWFFMLATTALGFTMAALFNRSMTAAILSSIVYVVGYAIYEAVWQDTVSASAKRAACLHPVTCFTLATLPLAEYEGAGVGVTSDTISSSETNNFTFGDALGMLILDIFLFYFIAWYLDKVTPKEWGVAQPFYFFLTPSYWRSCLGCKDENNYTLLTRDELTTQKESRYLEPASRDKVDEIADGQGIAVRGLRRVFHTNAGDKVAVQGLDLDFFQGEITALLGHNGAGKTTVMNMITGMLPPTEGTAQVNGRDIRVGMAEIRQELGVCPQHDILFDELTVQEHLRLFATFKGVPASEQEAEVEKMIRMVGLTEKRQNRSKELSGGMKRKLSVGIAFIGGSKVIVLDEPTSGMDPYSRRFTWNVIRNNKEGRIIVLTTHFMDEADLLGDRVAIMGEGALKCVGSSLFLKQLFGVGYQLTLEKGRDFKEAEVRSLVSEKVPKAKELNNVGTELSFQVPFSSAHAFSELFKNLDAKSEEWKLEAYGVSVTTLEEVFIKVARGESAIGEDNLEAADGSSDLRRSSSNRLKSIEPDAEGKTNEAGPVVHTEMAEPETEAQRGSLLRPPTEFEVYDRNRSGLYFMLHMRALLIKRFIVFRRDYKPWICQYVIPLLFVLVGIGIVSRIPDDFDQDLLVLNTNGYNGGGADSNPLMYTTPGTTYNADFDGITLDICTAYGYDSSATVCPLLSNPPDEPVVNTNEPVMDNAEAAGGVSPFPDYDGSSDADPIEGFSRQLLANRARTVDTAYGAIQFGYAEDTQDLATSETVPTYLYTVYANYSALHAGPIFDAIMQEAILKTVDADASFTVKNHPLPETKKQAAINEQANTFAAITILLLALPFIPAGFITVPVDEVATKSKHQQVVSGVGYAAYWLSHWVFDVLSYQPSWLLIYAFLAAFDIGTLTEGRDGAAVAVLFLLYGFSVAGFTYITSFVFQKPASARVLTIMLHFITGFLLVFASFIMALIPSTRAVNEDLSFLFRLFPTFSLGHGIMWIALSEIFFIIGSSESTNPFHRDVALYDIVFLAWQSVLYVLIAILIEHLRQYKGIRSLFSRTQVTPDDLALEGLDEDVARENERVGSGEAAKELIVIDQVAHKYGTGKVAVKGVSLGIPNGQCFGLLGINGAGKTSLLSILSGEFPPSHGTASLDGHDLLDDPVSVRRLIGYCPQFDALFEFLTGREHLALYARIKGVAEKDIPAVVEDKATQMDLLNHWERSAGRYSGGNKRKLSVACAMIGEPKIVFLDEPSTGMDPFAKRFMWDVISAIATREGKCAVILTTHSMEECEALCSRIGIMVGGRFRCLGSSTHLKTRFGLGFSLEVALKLPSPEAAAALGERVGGSTTPIPGDRIPEAMVAAGHPGWEHKVTESGAGASLAFSLAHNGSVLGSELADWVLLEENKVRLHESLEGKYPELKLREAQGKKVRYELPGHTPDGEKIGLGSVFDTMESLKEPCHIQEYSLSVTSLEQVFNGFAALQEEEQGQAAGIVN